MLKLNWPLESTQKETSHYQWSDYHANILLDLHGNPQHSVLTVFSDGNHHMALEESLSYFSKHYLEKKSIFYLTLPPHVLAGIIANSGLQIGNYSISLSPDLIIGPEPFVTKYSQKLKFNAPKKIAKSLGNSLLLRKSLNCNLCSIKELIESKLRLFISSPSREKASFEVYWQSLINLAHHENLEKTLIDSWFQLENEIIINENIIIGEHVHHREAPEYLLQNKADITLLYHHLALRYVRLFPNEFTLQPLYQSGTEQCLKEQVRTEYFASANDNAIALFDFLQSEKNKAIYRSHGLSY